MIHSVGELNLIWSENWFILSGFERANFSLSARWMSNISGRRRASTTAQPRALDNTFNKRGDSTRAAPFWFELIGEWIYPFIVNLRSLTGLVSPSMASAGISRRPTRVVTSVEEHWRWIARGGGGGGRRRSRTTNFNWQECGGPAVRTWSLGLSGFPFFDFFFFPFFYMYIYIYIFFLPSFISFPLASSPPPWVWPSSSPLPLQPTGPSQIGIVEYFCLVSSTTAMARRRSGLCGSRRGGEETRLEDVVSALNIFHACSLPPTVGAGE